jgi:hypothetical protein
VARPKKPKHPPKPEYSGVPFNMAIRMFLIGSVAVAAALYAIWRHYSVPRTSMLVPVPSASASASPPDEIPVDFDPTK